MPVKYALSVQDVCVVEMNLLSFLIIRSSEYHMYSCLK